jgi:hypothetical protein
MNKGKHTNIFTTIYQSTNTVRRKFEKCVAYMGHKRNAHKNFVEKYVGKRTWET